MTEAAFVIWFIFMAVAVTTILTVGTLGAAGLLHRPRRGDESEKGSDGDYPQQPEEAGTRQNSRSTSVHQQSTEAIDALIPLGSSLSFVWHPKSQGAVDHSTGHEDPPRGRAA